MNKRPSHSSEPLRQVARIWRYRQRVEYEAADQFRRLGADLKTAYGKNEISELAAEAASDEITHASFCEKIIKECGEPVPSLRPELGAALGPTSLDLRRRTLFACVSLSCVTETLSTALLVEMQSRAKPAVVRDVVHKILEDEVSHSRLGWAQLALVAGREDVSWIAPYVEGMIRVAIQSDVKPMIGEEADLGAYGILGSAEAKTIMRETIRLVIVPGLKKFGIQFNEGSRLPKNRSALFMNSC